MNAPALSENGSSETGHCSNVSDSGRVCNAPRSSVLFDGIPTLTGLEGDMWASQLLTLNTSTSSANITFDFSNPTDRNGPTYYAGVSVIEVVTFNCPAREIGTRYVTVYGYGNIVDIIPVVPHSCENLVSACITLSTTATKLILHFSISFERVYLAEIKFYSDEHRTCSPTGPIITGSVATAARTIAGR